MNISQRTVMRCGWGVKACMVREWVAGKTVRSPCYHGQYLSALAMRSFHNMAPYKCPITLLYFTGHKWHVVTYTGWDKKPDCFFESLCKEYWNTVTYSTPVLLRIKYWTVWYKQRYSVSTYTGVTNFQRTVRFFGPPFICLTHNLLLQQHCKLR